MRRTSTVLSISRPRTPSISSDRDVDALSLSGSIIKGGPLKAPTVPPTTNPSPIAESPIKEAAAIAQEVVGTSPLAQTATSSEEVPPKPTTLSPVSELQSPTGYIPPPVLDSTLGNPGAFTDGLVELPQPEIVKDPYTVAAVEPNTAESATSVDDAPEPVAAVEPHVEPTTVEPVTVQHEVIEDLHVVAAVETHVPALVDAPEPVTLVPESTRQYEPEPEGTHTEEPTVYFDKPFAESVEDFEPTDHIDHTTVPTSEAVDKNVVTAALPQEPDYGNGEAAEYYRGPVVPMMTTSRAVDENVKTVLPKPKVEVEVVDKQKHVIAVTTTTTERERRQESETTKSISMPVPVPTYDVPSYPMNLGSSGQEVWGGDEHDYGRQDMPNPYENAYPSSVVPVIISSSEDLKPVERTPSVRFVHFLIGLDLGFNYLI